MPELDFKILGAEPSVRGVIPLLNFRLQITGQPATETIHSILLRAQIQIAAPKRDYNDEEKKKLVELFGEPSRWGQTLRNRLWTNATTCIGAFTGTTETLLTVPCTYDLNVAATKYFYALEQGDVPLVFLFSGTVFHAGAGGALQVHQIPWTDECTFSLSSSAWQEIMEELFPRSAWLYLNREVFERLYAYKRREGLATWEETIERLLPAEESAKVLA